MVMFVARREASVSNLSPLALAATGLGTFSTLFVAPIQSSNVPSAVTVSIQLVGLVMATVAMGSLRRSFGLAPANRGVKTSGMYRYVRHPLYAAYLSPSSGYVLALSCAAKLHRAGLRRRRP